MTSYHKMVVGLAIVGLFAFAIWAGQAPGLIGTDVPSYTKIESTEKGTRRREPSMNGPRGAIPAAPPHTWVVSDDYPSIALDGDIEGRTGFRVVVSPFGEVSSCEITKPSGYTELDERVCNAISTRARFYPALDKNDQPTEGAYSAHVVWIISE